MQPPMTTIMLNSQLISIEKYVEKPPQGAKVNAWFKLKATPRHEIAPGQIYHEEYLDADEDAGTEGDKQRPKNGEGKPSNEGGGQAQGYKDVLMNEANVVEERRQPAKRRNNEMVSSPGEDPSKEQQQDEGIVTFLKQMLEEKDEQMKGIRKTIDALNDRLAKMQETLDRMERQQPVAEQENL